MIRKILYISPIVVKDFYGYVNNENEIGMFEHFEEAGDTTKLLLEIIKKKEQKHLHQYGVQLTRGFVNN